MTQIPSFIYKKSNQVTMIVFVPIFAFVFVNIYRPLDFDKIDADFLSWLNISRELALQLITILMILVGMAVVAISRSIMGWYTRNQKHTMSYVKYIAWVSLEILIMAGIFTIAAFFTDTGKDVLTLFQNSLMKTVLILLIPYVMCYIYFIWQERVSQLRVIRERLAENETVLQSAYIQILDDKGDMRLSVRRENLLFVGSADNYICVWYMNKNTPKKQMVRNSMKNLSEQLVDSRIIRCHRSYMVNLDAIKVLRREKEGVFIELGVEGVPDIPISKSYIENINKWLNE